jgi:peptide/nickel transport system ATP-binding protein/oligopeptide transport system ATP-binding protein
VEALFDRPLHPYTRGLLDCVPTLEQEKARLLAIAGALPEPARRPPGCRFAPRCPLVLDACRAAIPPLARQQPGHAAACIRLDAP